VSAIASSAGPGRARTPNAFLCNSQPKICNSVELFYLKIAWNSDAPALGDSAHAADTVHCCTTEWRGYLQATHGAAGVVHVVPSRHTAPTDSERQCADTIGTVPLPSCRAGHFQCKNIFKYFQFYAAFKNMRTAKTNESVSVGAQHPSADTLRHLHSANRHLLAVPRFPLNTYGRRAFSVAGPMAWNSLPGFFRDPTSSTDCFRRLGLLKT